MSVQLLCIQVSSCTSRDFHHAVCCSLKQAFPSHLLQPLLSHNPLLFVSVTTTLVSGHTVFFPKQPSSQSPTTP